MTPRRSIAMVVIAAALFAAACEKDPHDPATWIDKLDDRVELNEALRNLERLKREKSANNAVKPLGDAWKKQNRDSRILRVMIAVAGYEDPKTGKVPAWDKALPYLLDAVENYDPGDQRSREDAGVAADALGRAGAQEALPLLIATANKVLPKLSPENHVRIAAVRALGKFKDPKAVDTLIKILETDPEKQIIRLNAAAALALAETGDPRALPALTVALFRGPIYRQVRTGITRVGKPAVAAMMNMYQHKDAAVEQFAKEKKFAEVAPGNIEYKAALLLGDLRATEAVPMLLEGLKKEPKVSYFDEKTGAAGPSTHEAIFDALKRIAIGDDKAAAAIKEYWKNPKTDDFIRPMAIDVYSMLAKTPSKDDLDDLFKLMSDETQEDQIRAAATLAYGRLARSAADQKRLDELVAKYEERGKKAEEKAKGATNEADKASAEAQAELATQWKNTLQESSYRLSAAVECKEDPACYVKLLGGKDVSQGKPGLPKAERAVIELAKMGEKARPVQKDLLGFVDSRERFVREGVLLALPKIVALPCAECSKRTEEVIEKQSNESTLDLLTEETRVVHHYFLWAGK